MPIEVRKIVVQLEETHREAGRAVTPPVRKVTVAAVMRNPLAGRFHDDVGELVDAGAEVSALLVERGLEALGVGEGGIDAYGKAAIVGTDGELEHAAALLHPRFGAPVRLAVGGGESIIPSTKKVGPPGASISMPLVHRNVIWSFDEMDATEIAIPDAPRADEVVVCLALGIGGRPLARTRPVS